MLLLLLLVLPLPSLLPLQCLFKQQLVTASSGKQIFYSCVSEIVLPLLFRFYYCCCLAVAIAIDAEIMLVKRSCCLPILLDVGASSGFVFLRSCFWSSVLVALLIVLLLMAAGVIVDCQ